MRYQSAIGFSRLHLDDFVDNSADRRDIATTIGIVFFLYGLFLNGFHDSRREISSGRELKFVMVRFYVRQSIWTYV